MAVAISGGCCAPYRSYESHKPYSSSFDLLSIQDGTPVERFADAAEALEQHIQNLIRGMGDRRPRFDFD